MRMALVIAGVLVATCGLMLMRGTGLIVAPLMFVALGAILILIPILRGRAS